MHTLRPVRALVVGLALALTAGCTSTSTSTTAPDGEFRFAYTAFPSTLDPHMASTAWDDLYLLHVYDRLVTITPDQEFAPQVAESWERDGDEMVFTVRDDAVFHDSTPVTPEAVDANLERAMTAEGSTVAPTLSMITDVRVEGDSVAIGFTGSEENLLDALAHRGGALISPAAFDNEDLDRAPVGSGPYVVTEFSRDNRVYYSAFEDYHTPEDARLDHLEMAFVDDDDTRLNGLRSGQYDAAVIRPEQQSSAETAGLDIHAFLTGLVYQVNINSGAPPLDDVLVRQALNHAVDRQAISEQLLEDSCEPAVQAAPEEHWSHEPDVADSYAYDPEEARRLLAEAGLPDGFSFTALVWNNTAFVQLGEVLQDQFREVGVDMDLQPMTADQSLDVYQQRGEADALISQIGAAGHDPRLITQQDLLPGGLNNPGGLDVPEISELADEAETADDRDGQADAYREIARLSVEHAFNVPVCNRVLHYATDERAADFGDLLTGYDDMRVVGVEEGSA